MKTHTLTRHTTIEKPIDEVFDFFTKAENLNKIIPPDLHFEMITKLPISIKKGTVIDYKIKIAGIPFKWKTEITEWNPPYSFEDTQVKGPYKIWIHKHKFESKNGFTLMTDIINYLSPGGIFEFVPHRLFVKKKVESIFDFREKSLIKIFER